MNKKNILLKKKDKQKKENKWLRIAGESNKKSNSKVLNNLFKGDNSLYYCVTYSLAFGNTHVLKIAAHLSLSSSWLANSPF